MKEEINHYFKRMGLDEKSAASLKKICFLKEYHSGERIISMGERSNHICLVIRGIVRGFYIDADGNETTKCFSKENEWCCSYNYLTDGPSPFFVEAAENVCLACFDVKKISQLIEENLHIRKMRDEILESVFMESERRIMSFSRMNAHERYNLFLRENPELCTRIKLEHLASYLGITPSSLSRIRRKH